ncbi:hypothetical protein [Nocardia brasiliensis]|uniref:hypothetical protein n=1 Tax=Nocardia brasiliensis TaxID=37326 RepID=UPI000310C5BF|nr:hypothetical protein [Nocardia brasiliensis]ASF09824.1 hypothetical protein CEQ30_23440 [Nocardia brasiliensis]
MSPGDIAILASDGAAAFARLSPGLSGLTAAVVITVLPYHRSAGQWCKRPTAWRVEQATAAGSGHRRSIR